MTAYREALKERTALRVALQMGGDATGLGNALARWGERASTTALLEQAVAAYSEALKEDTRQQVPLNWAICVGNHGIAVRSAAPSSRRSDP